MAEFNISNFPNAPYFDDFTKAKKFLRILFRPGYSVQARELTQLQTILQGQVTSAGDYMFKDGSVVSNGQFTTHPCKYLRVEQTIPQGAQAFNKTNFVNNVISTIGSSSVTGAVIETSTKAKILHIEEPTTSDPYYVFFYENLEGNTLEASVDANVTGTQSSDLVLTTIAYNSQGSLVNTDKRILVKKKTGDWKDQVQTHGDAVLASNDEGIFYLDGYYVLGSKQTIPLHKDARKLSTIIGSTPGTDGIEIENQVAPGTPPTNYTSALNNFIEATSENENLVGIRLFQFPSSRVGFDILRETISSSEDVTLLDNAYGSYNYAAPGADRYRISLTLKQYQFFNDEDQAKLSDFTSGSKFIEKLRVLDGEVSLVEKYPTLSDIEDTLARRTYDESGNYTVRPFEFDVKEYLRKDEYIVTRKVANSNERFSRGDRVEGTNPDGTVWTGIVSSNDAFLGRFGELDFDSVDDGQETPGKWGTTKLYPVSGVPMAGSSMSASVSSTMSGGATIATDELFQTIIRASLGLAETETAYLPSKVAENAPVTKYNSVYSPVNFVSDPLGGSNSLSSLGITGMDGVATADSKLEISISAGKAYVFGYEYETTVPKKIVVNKARTTASTTQQEVPFSVGNFVLCHIPDGGISGNLAEGFELSSHKEVDLYGASRSSTITSLPGKIGSAKIRTVNFDMSTSLVEVYLYDVVMDSGATFKNVQQIVKKGSSNSGSGLMFVIDEANGVATYSNAVSGADAGETLLFGTKSNSLILPLPTNTSVKTITEFGKAEVSKTFISGAAVTQNSAVKYFSFPNIMSSSIYIDIAKLNAGDIQDIATIWSGSDQQIDSIDPVFQSAFVSEFANFSLIPDDYLKSRYALIDHSNGKVYDLSGDDFLVATKYNDQKQLVVAVKGTTSEEITAGDKVTLQCTVIVNANDAQELSVSDKYIQSVSEFAQKTLVHSETLESEWSTFFDSSTSVLAGDSLSLRAGYLKVPLANHNIYTEAGSVSNLKWQTFDEPGETLAPLYYETNLGVSDVYELDEVLCLFREKPNDPIELREITEYFELDDNASDNLYDHSRIFVASEDIRNLMNAGAFPVQQENGKDYRDFTLYTRFRFFNREGRGPIIVNSYNHDNHHPTFDKYEDIPIHTSSLYGTSLELRNCIDYRPLRTKIDPRKAALAATDGVDNYSEVKDNFIEGNFDSKTSIIKPVIAVNAVTNPLPEVSYETYLPRFSKIMLTRDRDMIIEDGEPAVLPETPNDSDESMTLYSLQVPEYTYNPEDIEATYIDLRRYTMEDIGKLEKRIETVEYFTTLTELEKETEDMVVTDSFGTERIKNGILVDDFKGHSVGDVLHRDYNCAMDFEKGELRPTFESVNISLADADLESGARSGVVKTSDNIVTRRYVGDSGDVSGIKPPKWANQPFASNSVSVNPFDVTNWLGSGKLSPSSDTWIDTKVTPKVKTNFDGENDAWKKPTSTVEPSTFDTTGKKVTKQVRSFGSQWNFWETLWSGSKLKKQDKVETFKKKFAAPKTRTRRGHRFNPSVPGHSIPAVARSRFSRFTSGIDRIKKIGIDKKTKIERPTLTPKRVEKQVSGKTVDNSVIPYIRSRDVIFTAEGMKPNTTVHAFFDGVNVDQYCSDYVSGIAWNKTDFNGKAVVKFTIPAGMFQTGEREFRLTDEPTNDESKASTSAEATYYAQGMLQQKSDSILSTRVPVIKRATVKSNRIDRDAISRTKTVSKDTKNEFRDPVAQTFTVDAKRNPNGVWIQSVNLFFSQKPLEKIPVTLQIRPTVSGIPHNSMILPFSEVTVNRDDVNIAAAVAADKSDIPDTDKASTYTTFKFSSPVYLKPGEYAIVLESNSSEYKTYVAEMAQTRIGSTERINTRASSGMFFNSQNGSKWEPNPNMDLMYTINRCKFKSDSEQVMQFGIDTKDPDLVDGKIECNVIKVISSDMQFDTSKIKAVITVPTSGLNEPSEYTVSLNENIHFPFTKVLSAENFNVKLTIDDTGEELSPVVDLDRFSLIATKNKISSTVSNDESMPFAKSASDSVARYITRRVELSEGVECDDFKVYLNAYRPKTKIGSTTATTDISVYAKVQTIEDDTNFEELPWIKMDLDPAQLEAYSDKEGDIIEYEYTIPEIFFNPISNTNENTGYSKEYEAFTDPISRYCFKIVLNSDNSGVIPTVKNFKAIAVT